MRSSAHRRLARFWIAAALIDGVACSETQVPSAEDLLPNVERQAATSAAKVQLPGLSRPALLVGDRNGVPHIFATNLHDVYFMQGWVHARDRLFQMDVLRRRAGGTLAELLGPAALASDVELRTLGLQRAAQRSWDVLSQPAQAVLEAYSAGVNAYLERHGLPSQYTLLEISSIAEWSPIDTLALIKAITFSLAFKLDIEQSVALATYEQTGNALGFNGRALFFEDIYRSAPFDPAATIPDATRVDARAVLMPGVSGGPLANAATRATGPGDRALLEMAEGLAARFSRVSLLADKDDVGSNGWVIAGRHTRSGRPLFANDPHLDLPYPSIFYQARLAVHGELDVIGSGFAGLPGIVLGHNRQLSWGLTVNAVDVTDVYQERIVPDANSPSGLATVYRGQQEALIPIPQTFRYNQLGDGEADNLTLAQGQVGDVSIPAATLIVPRRNQGPIVQLDRAAGTALSVQFTGFSGTREVEAFLGIDRAENLQQFQRALQYYDTGSLNVLYADRRGNIAYFATGEIPLREDLEAGKVEGAAPFLIRSGSGGNEWVSVGDRPETQAVPFAVLPPQELPQVVNPSSGLLINANNNPLDTLLDNDALNQFRPSGGIFYIDWYYRSSWRAGRISQVLGQGLAAEQRFSRGDMQRLQSDTVLLDAQVFVPYLLAAAERAQAEDAVERLAELLEDARVAEAVERLSHWNFSTPTGVAQGYDASDVDGRLRAPSADEIRASVAATIYAVWRARLVANTVDATLQSRDLPLPSDRRPLVTLRHLLDNFATSQGVGASGLDFFAVTGVEDAADRRDIVLLRSLQEALDQLAGPDYQQAFAGSTEQSDYRWGRLHRIVFSHPLGGPYNVPPASGTFPPLFSDLDGIAADGGFGTVDAAFHNTRGRGDDGFVFSRGAAHRYVAKLGRRTIAANNSLPGGQSGRLQSPHYSDLLGKWLTNDSYDFSLSYWQLLRNLESVETFVP